MPLIYSMRGGHETGRRDEKICLWHLPGKSALLWIALSLLSAQVATAAQDDAHLCDRAAQVASQAEGVPLDVLQAISRTETGRSGERGLEPWPWTVNMEGTGRWFHTEDEARAHVFSHFKRGARSFDVGCFQINYKWHGEAFRSIDEMFDPTLNARYAARFLLQLYGEFGDWSAAAGAYHSRTPSYARSYAERFDRVRGNVPGAGQGGATRLAARARGRELSGPSNGAPFIGDGVIALGSLVPVSAAGASASGAFIRLE